MTLRYSHLAPAHTLQAVQRLCRPTSAAESDATGTTTGTSDSARAARERLDFTTTAAPDPAGASERAGDRGRTGDVQLGKLVEEAPEDYDTWG